MTRNELHTLAHTITALPTEGAIITGVAAGMSVAWTAQQWQAWRVAKRKASRAGKVAA